jgi:hypothetical protein
MTENDFFYRFNEKISRSVAIGCIAFVERSRAGHGSTIILFFFP